MDLLGTFVIKDVLYPLTGARAVYRSARLWYWNSNQVADNTPQGRLINDAREKQLREWGRFWAGKYTARQQPRPLMERLRDGEEFDVFKDKHSYQDLYTFSQYENEKIYETVELEKQRVLARGPVGRYARLYRKLTNPATQLEGETDIEKFCSRNAHRAAVLQHFLHRISHSYEIANKLDKRQRLRNILESVLPDLYKKGFDTENTIMQLLMKMLRMMG